MIKYILFSFVVVSLTSCASYNHFHTARTVGDDALDYGLGFGYGSSSFSDDLDNTTASEDNVSIAYPDMIGFIRYGFSEKFDMGVIGSSSGNIGLDLKYQLIGDRYSGNNFYLSSGAEYTSNWLAIIEDVSFSQYVLPIYTSYYFTQNFGISLGARYMHIRSNLVEDDGTYNLIGFTLGLEIMTRKGVRFYLGANSQAPFNSNSKIGNNYTIGLSIGKTVQL